MDKVTVKLNAIKEGEPIKRPMDKCDKVEVTLTLIHPDDDKPSDEEGQKGKGASIEKIRERRAKRLIKEAQAQGAELNPEILSNLLPSSISTAKHHRKKLEIRGDVKPRAVPKKPKKLSLEELKEKANREVMSREPFRPNKNYSDVFNYLVSEYYSMEERRKAHLRKAIFALALLAGGPHSFIKNTSRYVIIRIKKEFEERDVFLESGGQVAHRRCIEKVCDHLDIKGKRRQKALEEIESRYYNLPKSLPKAACCAAILLKHSKESNSKVSYALGVPEEVTQKAYKRIYQKSPPQQKGKPSAQEEKSRKTAPQTSKETTGKDKSFKDELLEELQIEKTFKELRKKFPHKTKATIRGMVYKRMKKGEVKRIGKKRDPNAKYVVRDTDDEEATS